MEFCGGHTHTIYRYGLPSLLSPNVKMIHGPGCPVCVLPIARIDYAIALAKKSGGDFLQLWRHVTSPWFPATQFIACKSTRCKMCEWFIL